MSLWLCRKDIKCCLCKLLTKTNIQINILHIMSGEIASSGQYKVACPSLLMISHNPVWFDGWWKRSEGKFERSKFIFKYWFFFFLNEWRYFILRKKSFVVILLWLKISNILTNILILYTQTTSRRLTRQQSSL